MSKNIIVIFKDSSERRERGKFSVFISHKFQFIVKSRDSRTFSRNSREKYKGKKKEGKLGPV